MPFPLTYHHKLKWAGIVDRDVEKFNDMFLSKVVKELEKAKAKDIVIHKKRVFFKGGMFRFVSNWNVLFPISEGYIEGLTSNNNDYAISYDINLKQFFVYVSLIMVAGSLFFVFATLPLVGKMFFITLLGFYILLGYVSAVLRFNFFVDRILKEAKVAELQ